MSDWLGDDRLGVGKAPPGRRGRAALINGPAALTESTRPVPTKSPNGRVERNAATDEAAR
jgi:hypothetical protein